MVWPGSKVLAAKTPIVIMVRLPLIKCFHDYLTLGQSKIFIVYANTKIHQSCKVQNTAFHMVSQSLEEDLEPLCARPRDDLSHLNCRTKGLASG